MMNDPLLEWTKRLIYKWVYVNNPSFICYINRIPISPTQKYILINYFIPNNENKTLTFKEIEFNLNKSHDYVMKEYRKTIQILLDNLDSFIIQHFPNDL
jgi:hypothetical protein